MLYEKSFRFHSSSLLSLWNFVIQSFIFILILKFRINVYYSKISFCKLNFEIICLLSSQRIFWDLIIILSISLQSLRVSTVFIVEDIFCIINLGSLVILVLLKYNFLDIHYYLWGFVSTEPLYTNPYALHDLRIF